MTAGGVAAADSTGVGAVAAIEGTSVGSDSGSVIDATGRVAMECLEARCTGRRRRTIAESDTITTTKAAAIATMANAMA